MSRRKIETKTVIVAATAREGATWFRTRIVFLCSTEQAMREAHEIYGFKSFVFEDGREGDFLNGIRKTKTSFKGALESKTWAAQNPEIKEAHKGLFGGKK
jgi:hypothetical protein